MLTRERVMMMMKKMRNPMVTRTKVETMTIARQRKGKRWRAMTMKLRRKLMSRVKTNDRPGECVTLGNLEDFVSRGKRSENSIVEKPVEHAS